MRTTYAWPAVWLLAGSILSGHLVAQTTAAPTRIAETEYARRRMALIGQAGPGGIVLVADGEHEDLGRAGADFRYLTGGSLPGAILLLNADPAKPKSAAVAFPNGAQPEDKAFWRGKTLSESDVDARIKEAVGRSAPILSSESLRARVQKAAAEATIGRVEHAVNRLRAVKSPAELALSKRAIEITIQGHIAAAQACRPGRNESDLQKAIVAAFRKGGSPRDAFPCIVGSGPNSCIPHYFDNNRTMSAGDLVVVDIGAEFGDYAADLTRTYPVEGRFSPRQLQLYGAVLEAQRAAEKAAQPGASLNDLERAARGALRASPLRAADPAGKEQPLDTFFIHGLGHSIGLEVHDPLPNGPIPVGALFTIEPGVYIESESTGIRIEDDYLMTDKGAVKLSASLPSSPKDIEKMLVARPASGAKTRP